MSTTLLFELYKRTRSKCMLLSNIVSLGEEVGRWALDEGGGVGYNERG
jgi:hypothetical protein